MHIGDIDDRAEIRRLVSPLRWDLLRPAEPVQPWRRRCRPFRLKISTDSSTRWSAGDDEREAEYRPPIARNAITCEHAAATVLAVIDEVERAVVGKREELESSSPPCWPAVMLLDDVPGVAKTLAARSIATAAGLSFSRIQFTPDVLPSDITGATVID